MCVGPERALVKTCMHEMSNKLKGKQQGNEANKNTHDGPAVASRCRRLRRRLARLPVRRVSKPVVRPRIRLSVD